MIDDEKALLSFQHFVVFEALRKIIINDNYIQTLENTYRNATTQKHKNNLMSEAFQIYREIKPAAIEEL